MNRPKFSICIPVWEQYGDGVRFLSKNLESIQQQTFRDFEVVISDHSFDDEIHDLCKKFEKKFTINYLKYENNRGNGPANTNNCIRNSTGELIKIIFQDDFFVDENALLLITNEFNNKDCHWLVTGSNHTSDDGINFFNPMVPRWNDELIIGVNTISSPSVLCFRNEDPCLFDENLVMLMDCEMYYQLYKRFGYPKILNNILVTNRLHSKQISVLYKKDIIDEINYIKLKHKMPNHE